MTGPAVEQPNGAGASAEAAKLAGGVSEWLRQGEALADAMAAEGEALLVRGKALVAEAKALRDMLKPKGKGKRSIWSPEQRVAQGARLREAMRRKHEEAQAR